MLVAENVKALRKLLPVLEAEYGKAGYKCHAQLFNSKYWGVPQNRERYIVVGTLDSLPDTYTYPEEQHDYVPKLSTILEADVDDKFYIADEKAHKIIDQALQRLSSMGNVHATITPDRVDKRQNGRRAKEDEDPMFTLTAQDLHGVIQKDLIPDGEDAASALIHSRGLETRKDGISHCVKGGTGGSSKNFLVERTPLTEVCVNERGFVDKQPQISDVFPTLRAENHVNHPKVIEDTIERERETALTANDDYYEKRYGKDAPLLPIAEATKAGIAVGRYGDAINIAYPESNTRRGRVGKEIAQSLLTGCSQVVICDKKGGENDT